MIKCAIYILCIMLALLTLFGCGNADSKVNQVIQSQMQDEANLSNEEEDYTTDDTFTITEETEAESVEVVEENIEETTIEGNKEEPAEEENEEAAPAEEGIVEEDSAEEQDYQEGTNNTVDVDLTILSSTMVYSEVYNMMYFPESYIGKTVKMNGMFSVYTNQDGSQFYPVVIIADATACCSQGLEFVLEGNPPYPDGYPELGMDVTVVGTFETYDEDGYTYCRLQNARISTGDGSFVTRSVTLSHT